MDFVVIIAKPRIRLLIHLFIGLRKKDSNTLTYLSSYRCVIGNCPHLHILLFGLNLDCGTRSGCLYKPFARVQTYAATSLCTKRLVILFRSILPVVRQSHFSFLSAARDERMQDVRKLFSRSGRSSDGPGPFTCLILTYIGHLRLERSKV